MSGARVAVNLLAHLPVHPSLLLGVAEEATQVYVPTLDMNLAPFLMAIVHGVELATPNLDRELAESGVGPEEFRSLSQVLLSEPWLEDIRVTPLRELDEGYHLFELDPDQFEQTTASFTVRETRQPPASTWIEVAELIDGRRWLFPNGDWVPDGIDESRRVPIAVFAPAHDSQHPGTWFLGSRLLRWNRGGELEEEALESRQCGYKSEGWKLWCESTGCPLKCWPLRTPGKFDSDLLSCVCAEASLSVEPTEYDVIGRRIPRASDQPVPG